MRNPAAMLAVACLALRMVPSSSFHTTFPALRLRATSPPIRSGLKTLPMKSGGEMKGSQNDDIQKKERRPNDHAFWDIFRMETSEEVDTEGHLDKHADQLKRNIDLNQLKRNLDNHANQLKRNLEAYSDSNPAEVDTDDNIGKENQTKNQLKRNIDQIKRNLDHANQLKRNLDANQLQEYLAAHNQLKRNLDAYSDSLSTDTPAYVDTDDNLDEVTSQPTPHTQTLKPSNPQTLIPQSQSYP